MGNHKRSDDNQPELIERFMAQDVAEQFVIEAEEGDSPLSVLVKFISDMEANDKCKKHDSYLFIHVVGFGEIKNCFVWWMQDDSVVMVGISPAETFDDESTESLMVGVLPPGCTFNPVPFTDAGIATVH